MKLTLVVLVHDQNSKGKNLNMLKTVRDFKMKWKAFFVIFKGFNNIDKNQTNSFVMGEPDFKRELSEEFKRKLTKILINWVWM